MKIGKKLKELRILKNVSSSDVAEVINMSIGNYHKVERNEVSLSIDNVQKLANFYQISIDELIKSETHYVAVTNNDGGK